MTQIKDFTSYKAKKNGDVLVEEVIENLYNAMKEGLVKDIVFVAVQPDGEVVHGLNTMDAFRAIGILDSGKDLIKMDIYEE